MANHVEAHADRNAASVTSKELSEAELATVAAGSNKAGGRVTFNSIHISKVIDKSSPCLFL